MIRRQEFEEAPVNAKVFVGYQPFYWQWVVHSGLETKNKGIGSGHIHCVLAKRQIGKSYIIINELLRTAINYKETISCLLSPTLNQARKIYKNILKLTDNTGVVAKKNDSLLEITFINGSQIVFKSAEQKENLRGYTYSGILCIDEAAYISDEIFGIVRPSTDVFKCPILMVSTPRFKRGFFYETFIRGTKQKFKYKNSISVYNLNKFDTSRMLSKETLEMYRQTLPKALFTTEYLGEFLDTQSIVFGNFKDCISNEVSEFNELYIGIDWASGAGGDSTNITAINEKNEQVFISNFNNKNTTQQIEYIVEYLQLYKNKIKCIVCENNGIGKPMVENLKSKIKNIHIEEHFTTNQNKIELINKLQVMLEQKQIQLLDNEKQTNELSTYECKVSKNGSVTYNSPAGAHDDTIMSLLFAIKAKDIKNKKGNYNISFIK